MPACVHLRVCMWSMDIWICTECVPVTAVDGCLHGSVQVWRSVTPTQLHWLHLVAMFSRE